MGKWRGYLHYALHSELRGSSLDMAILMGDVYASGSIPIGPSIVVMSTISRRVK